MHVTHGLRGNGRWLVISLDGKEFAFDREAPDHDIARMREDLQRLIDVAAETSRDLGTAARRRRYEAEPR